jgi:hypothetical protein
VPRSASTSRATRRLSAVALGALALVSPVLAGVFTAGPAAASGTTFYAAPSAQGGGTCADAADACTIDAAIGAATSGDTIDLEPGTYENAIDEQPGPIDLTITNDPDNPGQALIEGPGDEQSIFYNNAGADLTIAGIADAGEAGIEIVGSSTSAIINGTAGTPATLNVTGVDFDNDVNEGGSGGAIDNVNGSLSVTSSSFEDNIATVGGAIANQSGSMSVTTTSFYDNHATDDGGAIANAYAGADAATLSVTDSSFSDDGAEAHGTAISSADDASGTGYGLTISDSTFNDASASDVVYDGATTDPSNNFVVTATTFTQAGVNDINAPNAPLYIAADIFAGGCSLNGAANETDDGYNEETGSSCTNGGGGFDDVFNTTVSLGTYQDNGGPTDTAIPNAGDASLGLIPLNATVNLPANPTTPLCPATDERGVTSTAGTACDAGAVQVITTFYAAPTAAGTADCSSAADACALATAFGRYNPGDTIYLESGIYTGSWVLSASLTLAADPGDGATPQLDGNASATNPALALGSTGTYSLSGIAFENDANSTGDGSALQVDDTATVDVSSCSFTNDDAEVGNGGAIANTQGGTLSVTNSTFDDNATSGPDSYGGAIATGTGSTSDPTTTVSDSSFYNNFSGSGGAIDNGSNEGTGSLSVSGSTFDDNNASAYGGAINNASDFGTGSLSVSGSTFEENSAFHGGAVSNGAHLAGPASLTVATSTFTANLDVANDESGGVSIATGYDSTTPGIDAQISDSTFDDTSPNNEVIDSASTRSTNYTQVVASTFIQPSTTDISSGAEQVLLAADIFAGSCEFSGGLDDAGYNSGADASCENGGPGDSATGVTLEGLAGNGGPTETAIPNTADPSLGLIPLDTTVTLPSGSVALCPATDQRGVASTPGDACDAGAVQVPGPVATTTTVTPTGDATYGAETGEAFAVSVAPAPANGEAVTVTVGSSSCDATLTSGAGTCTLPSDTALAAGSYTASAAYPGDTTLAPSSGTATWAVEPDTTTTDLSITPTYVTYGNESQAVISVSVVTGAGEGLPSSSESVAVMYDTTTICTATLDTAGNGSCTPSDTALPIIVKGDYGLDAQYGGDADLSASASAGSAALVVSPDTSSQTQLSVDQSATYGAESTPVFTATVTTYDGEELPAAEPITINVGSGSCTATLTPAAHGGSGSCSLPGNNELAAGNYTASATYAGDADLPASISPGTTDFSVAPDSTTTSLSVTNPSVSAGHEAQASFSVTIASGNGESLPRNPASVTVNVGTASCVATLSHLEEPSIVYPNGQPRGPATGSCSIADSALPAGSYTGSVTYPGNTDFTASTGSASFDVISGCAGSGYRLAAADGSVFAYGAAPYLGSLPGDGISVHDIVGIAGSACGSGYWLVGSDGGVYAFGSAGFYGSATSTGVHDIVGMAVTSDAKGYWLVESDGAVYAFGDALYYGSMAGHTLNAPIVGIAPTVDGKGYQLAAADGGVFTYGDASFAGSMGGHSLNAPIVGIKTATSGSGYDLVASDGGIFSFGGAPFSGSMGGQTLAAPVVALIRVPGGPGYDEIASDGGVFAFGGAPFFGSRPVTSAPIVGADATGGTA